MPDLNLEHGTLLEARFEKYGELSDGSDPCDNQKPDLTVVFGLQGIADIFGGMSNAVVIRGRLLLEEAPQPPAARARTLELETSVLK
jgi:hypothetical protein